MTHWPVEIAALFAFAGTFIAAAALRSRPRLRTVLCLTIVGISWALLVRANQMEIDQRRSSIEARDARGEPISIDDALFDGTGDRLFMMLGGWLPAGVGFALGIVVARRIERSREIPRQ
jgi:hypothetical protein